MRRHAPAAPGYPRVTGEFGAQTVSQPSLHRQNCSLGVTGQNGKQGQYNQVLSEAGCLGALRSAWQRGLTSWVFDNHCGCHF